MRHGRAKAARKTLQFFGRTIGIKPPYSVLLDGTFLVAVSKYKFPLAERLKKVLQNAAFTLHTTGSVLKELETLKDAGGSLKRLELLEETIQWARKECQVVSEETILPLEKDAHLQLDPAMGAAGLDMLKLALSSSSSHYFVACHDETVLDVLRRAGTVPCLRLARGSVLLLEHPSKAGQGQARHQERKKWSAAGSVQDPERQLVRLVVQEKKQAAAAAAAAPIPLQRKKRKAKEPNPLSCKKGKGTNNDDDESPKKRRRKRKTASQES